MVGLRRVAPPAAPAEPPPRSSSATRARWAGIALAATATVAAGVAIVWAGLPNHKAPVPEFKMSAAAPLAVDVPQVPTVELLQAPMLAEPQPPPPAVETLQAPALAEPQPLPFAADPSQWPALAEREPLPPDDVLAMLPAAGQPLPGEEPTWQRNAVAATDPQGRPMIAVVIDDVGLDRRNADRLVRLPGPLTLAFMTYADDLPAQTRAARAAGHELLVHVPMQPLDAGLNAGFDVLRTDLPPDELRRRIDWGLSRFDGYVGINNHMGSRFTADVAGMSVLFEELHRRGLLFLDSRTTEATVGDAVAGRYDVPFVQRNIFLDNEASADAVGARLLQVEAAARRSGFAIAIGHPHDGTIEALERWLPTLAESGFALMPVSAIAKQNLNRELAARLFFGPESLVDLPHRE